MSTTNSIGLGMTTFAKVLQLGAVKRRHRRRRRERQTETLDLERKTHKAQRRTYGDRADSPEYMNNYAVAADSVESQCTCRLSPRGHSESHYTENSISR